MKAYILVFFSLLFLVSCQPSPKNEEADNKYFLNLLDEFSVILNQGDLISQPGKFQRLYSREQKKYKETGDVKYQLSSKFVKMFSLHQSPVKQLPVIYELLKLNNGKYACISTVGNLGLAIYFEENSPDLSYDFLNEAIKSDAAMGKKELPHLYHARGRWYFKKKQYVQAINYFKKARDIYIKNNNLLYVSSMHNNFGLCYYEMGKIDQAVIEGRKSVAILENKKGKSKEEDFYLHFFKGQLGKYLILIEDYKNAEKLLLEEWEFCKNNPLHYYDAIVTCQQLLNLYEKTGEIYKMDPFISFLLNIEPRLKETSQKIMVCNLAENYYLRINDAQNVKIMSKELLRLNEIHDKETTRNLSVISDQLNNYTIKNINQKYDYKMASQKRNNWLLLISSSVAVIILSMVVIIFRNRNKKEKELAQKEKQIFDNNKKIMEQDIELQKNKIRTLYLNLNLKVETEKVFLENLRKIKRAKQMNAEEVLKELSFKINNLIQINSGINDLIDESSEENRFFLEQMSTRFPFLTTQEKKFCVYFKLNLSSKEISLLEGITEGTVRVYKTRIKSKMGIDKDLFTFLNSF